MRNRYRVRSLMALTIAAIAAAVWFGGHAQQSASNEGALRVRQTRTQLIARLDTETGLRGFLLTGEEKFLAPYYAGIRRYRGVSAELTADGDLGADGDRLLAEEKALTESWLTQAASAIASKRGGLAPSAEWLSTSKAGMDQFRQVNATLQGRAGQHQSALQNRARNILLAIIVALGIGAAFLAYFVIERPARLKAQRRAQREEFAESLQFAGDESEAQNLVRRSLDRSIEASRAVVFSVNNSENRLEMASSPDEDSPLDARMPTAQPRDCLAVRQGRPFERSSKRDRLVECELCGATGENSVCMPSLVGGEVIGSVLVSRDSKPLDESEKRLAESTVTAAAPVLANLRNLAIAETRAVTDSLTGLANARAAARELERIAAFALRSGTPLVALMLDLDHFKRINDAFGHQIGDEVLASFGSLLQRDTRASDFVARYGGEEFLVLLQDTDLDSGREVADKIRGHVRQIQVPGFAGRVSVSIGLAAMPLHARDGDSLVRIADQALYTAKNAGRDQVCVPPDPDPATLLEDAASRS